VRGDLVRMFQTLFKTDAFKNLDWVVIETTGTLVTLDFTRGDCKKKWLQ
jgi:G3E family GTPase